jgi:hypothetical protein
MRASSARLTNSPVRLAELAFPQTGRLIHRTRLAFIHLDHVLSFAKRDRDGRVDGYLVAWLPDECLVLLLHTGEAVNAVSLHTTGRDVVPIAVAVRRLEAEVERGELAYCTAPLEQLAWMYESCAEPLMVRSVDARRPDALFPSLAEEEATGVLELISNGRVSYLRFDGGRFAGGYFCNRPESVPVAKYVESLFRDGPDGQPPSLSACLIPYTAELPPQAPPSLIQTYRDLYWRIADAVERELPGEGRRRAQRVSAGLSADHRALELLGAPRDASLAESVVQPDELASGLGEWAKQLLEGVEILMPGTAPQVLRDATREHRYLLQSAGFYDRLPWPVAW